MKRGHSILIAGGTLVDGTGRAPVRMDVAVDGPRISGVHPPGECDGAIVIDAEGCVVCPGFIDIHTHSEISLLACPFAESKVRQGVTTEVVGNCGGSSAPLLGEARDVAMEYGNQYSVDVDWATMEEYLLRLSNVRTSVNVATLV